MSRRPGWGGHPAGARLGPRLTGRRARRASPADPSARGAHRTEIEELGGIAVRDLREWLTRVEAMGELETIRGADWNLEIGTMCETWGPDAQALLFDEIVGYPRGMRVLTNSLQSPSRMTMTLGMEPLRGKLDAVKAIREKMRGLRHVPPEEVADGPVLEVVEEGPDVDLFKFPAPFWHELDGG